MSAGRVSVGEDGVAGADGDAGADTGRMGPVSTSPTARPTAVARAASHEADRERFIFGCV